MSIAGNAVNAFNKEISQALNSRVKVILDFDQNRYYIGRLVGFDINSQSIVLEKAADERNNKFDKIFIRGASWCSFSVEGEPFPMEKLLDRIKKILPGEEITLADDNKIYLLGGKLVVTENGVDGRGPTKERVQKVYEMFVEDLKKPSSN
jgi:small nuclear ribonucleoprotein (snRNP)-like protein